MPKHSSARRAPVDVVCCVDISGSMTSIASYEDPKTGKMTDDGLNLLDVVKHACKAVMFSLDENDRFSLVVFDDEADVIFPLDNMSDANRKIHVADLERTKTRGWTEMWKGIHASMEVLRNPPNKDQEEIRTKTMMVLTDGAS